MKIPGPYHKKTKPPDTTTPIIASRRCHCGTCNLCLDNARWEKKFNDKFADPDYYKSNGLSPGSTLGREK